MMELTDVRKSDPVSALGQLLGRLGAHGLQIQLEGDPMRFAISAECRGRRVSVSEHDDAHVAADALAHRLLDGTECRECGEIRTTAGSAPIVYATWGRSKRARCVWRRVGVDLPGNEWKRGCE